MDHCNIFVLFCKHCLLGKLMAFFLLSDVFFFCFKYWFTFRNQWHNGDESIMFCPDNQLICHNNLYELILKKMNVGMLVYITYFSHAKFNTNLAYLDHSVESEYVFIYSLEFADTVDFCKKKKCLGKKNKENSWWNIWGLEVNKYVFCISISHMHTRGFISPM